ncbi:MAG TPA: NADPH:quinone reductase [Verrucomicrobiae bacterium]|nr:NADPH:quinone reductase [Verrucomicrobiae bacterium]
MRAAWYERNGPAREVLTVGEMPDPVARPGEVLVRVHASGVNPSDVKSRAGARAPIAFPRVIPQSDGAGVIVAVGDGVAPSRVGQRVWIFNAQWQRPFGTAASLVALPAALTVPLPEGVGFAAGACLGIPASTAHQAVFCDGPVACKTVLVTGGAGAVGHYAIQLARWGGARVLATASSETKADHARAAGAEAVFNYREEDVVAAVMTATDGAGVDRIVEVEFGGNLAVSEKILKPHGTIAAYASTAAPTPAIPFYPLMFKAATIRLVLVYILTKEERAQTIADLTRAMEQGTLRHAVAESFPLEKIAAAHEAVESGKVMGNVVIEIEGA